MSESGSPSALKVALFDWDGTLVNTGNLLLSCWHEATSKVLGYKFPVEEADRRRVLAMRAVDSFPTITSGPEQTAELTRAFDAEYEPLAAEHVRAYARARDLLELLHSNGVRLGVVTSKTSLRRDIDGRVSGLDDLLDFIVTGDDVTHGKPDPEGIFLAMEKLGGQRENTVYVGDGPVDAKAGKAAGVYTVCITHGLHSQEEFADDDPGALVSDMTGVEGAIAGRFDI